MQPLRDYLNNTQQYEGILDPNQNKVMINMTDDAIRQHIREYCRFNRTKHHRGECWPIASPAIQVTKVDKDEKGWYVETECDDYVSLIFTANENTRSVYGYYISEGYRVDKQKGFWIKGIGIYFRWRKHRGEILFEQAPNLESTAGLPEELSILSLWKCCRKSKKLEVCDEINIIDLTADGSLKISGNGCKNIVIDPEFPYSDIEVPSGVKIYRPKTNSEYDDIIEKLNKH